MCNDVLHLLRGRAGRGDPPRPMRLVWEKETRQKKKHEKYELKTGPWEENQHLGRAGALRGSGISAGGLVCAGPTLLLLADSVRRVSISFSLAPVCSAS